MFSMILFSSAISVSTSEPSHLMFTPKSFAADLAPDFYRLPEFAAGTFGDYGNRQRFRSLFAISFCSGSCFGRRLAAARRAARQPHATR